MPVYDLDTTNLHLDREGAVPIPLEGFWAQLMSDAPSDPRIAAVAAGGWLVTVFDSDDAWPTWECHPHGDEVLYALSGSATFEVDGEGTVQLEAGKALRIPAGAWHRAVAGTVRILALTAGRGTEHRPA